MRIGLRIISDESDFEWGGVIENDGATGPGVEAVDFCADDFCGLVEVDGSL